MPIRPDILPDVLPDEAGALREGRVLDARGSWCRQPAEGRPTLARFSSTGPLVYLDICLCILYLNMSHNLYLYLY